MNRYSLWQYLLIAGSLVVGLLYTVPNFFGEVPAVQVQPHRAALKADSALMGRVEDILKKGGIAPTGVFLDAASVKARFTDTDTQLKAKDALQAQLGEDYVIALNLLSNSPRWLASIGALPMYLGLDLRGGVYFLLQVDMKAAIAKKMEATLNDVRSNLREKRIQYSGVAREGQAITVRFREQSMREKGLQEITRSLPDLDLKTIDDAHRRDAEARGAEENAGLLAAAEHYDAAQPGQRAGRCRAHHPAAGRGPRGGAAAGRAGHRQGKGHPRPHGDAGGADGG
jgi:preprotein translocase subunit SecD